MDDPSRAKSPWKLEIRTSFAGRKVRRFFETEGGAFNAGAEIVKKIRSKGVSSLNEREGGVSMKTACAAFRARHEGKSKSHKDKVGQICDMLQARFALAAVSPAQLESWFSTLPGSDTTRAMFYRYLRMFFGWAHRLELIQKNPIGAIDCPSAKPSRNILTPDQMKAVLEMDLADWMLATVLLGGFAGLRTIEIARMDWSDIDASTGEIHIRPGVGKDAGGFDQRIVNFTEPLTRRGEWLEKTSVKFHRGRIMPVALRAFHKERQALALALKWQSWPDNCLRHSFATYHLARSKNPSLTAFQMGHTSPAMVQRVYAVPACRSDYESWFAI